MNRLNYALPKTGALKVWAKRGTNDDRWRKTVKKNGDECQEYPTRPTSKTLTCPNNNGCMSGPGWPASATPPNWLAAAGSPLALALPRCLLLLLLLLLRLLLLPLLLLLLSSAVGSASAVGVSSATGRGQVREGSSARLEPALQQGVAALDLRKPGWQKGGWGASCGYVCVCLKAVAGPGAAGDSSSTLSLAGK